MTQRKQPRQNDDETPDLTASGTVGIGKPAGIQFSFDPQRPYLVVLLNDLGKTGLVDGNSSNGFFLRIMPGDHWLITFTLDPKWNWSFDHDAISFKTKGHAKHYKVISQDHQKVVIEAKSPYPVHNPGDNWPTPEDQPFNLYVLMSQSPNKTYPITIDPDVKNPPLGGQRIGAIPTSAVPLA